MILVKMKTVIFLLLLYLSCPIDMVFGENPVIIDGPDSVNVVDGTTVQFNCTVGFSGMDTREIDFFVNNTATNDPTIIQAGFNQSDSFETLNVTTLKLSLTATALSQYNNTEVYCRGLYTDAYGNIFGPVSSEVAVLLVKDAVGLSSTISSQISDLVTSSTMRDDSMSFSSVIEPSTSGLSSVSRITSTMAPSSTLGTSSVGSPTDPTSPEVSSNTGLIVGSVVASLVVLLLLVIGIRCLYCYCKIKEPHNDILPVRFTKPIPVTVHCLEGVLCVSSDSTIIKEQTELRDIHDDTLVVNNFHQETADVSSDNDTNIAAVPTAVENKSEGTLVEVHVHVPHQIITEKTTCENDLKVKSEGVEDSYIHKDVRKTIDNGTDSSLVTIDYKTSVERNEPIGFVNGNGVIPRKCTGPSSTYFSYLVPPGEISKQFDSSHGETGKPKSRSDIDMNFLDSDEETTTDVALDPQSGIIKSCPLNIYFNSVPPISSEPPPQIPHLHTNTDSVHQVQTPSIKTTSFSCIDNGNTKQEMFDEIPYVHNSQATPRSRSVLQIEDGNSLWKHCGTLPSHMINSLSLMRKDADSSVDGMKTDGGQKPFLSLQNDTDSDDVG